MSESIDWNDPILSRWLGAIIKKTTRYSYMTAFRAYTKFTRKTPAILIDEAIEDSRKDARKKMDVVKISLNNFYQYLINDYPVMSRGKGERTQIRTGVRPKTAHTWVNAIRGFYGVFDIYVKMKLPKARVVNKKLNLTTMDVKTLVDHTRTPRDRAIILTMFQSGLDVATLCSLKMKDVAEGIKSGKTPFKLEVFREKAGVKYYTFLGKDSVNAIEAYLRDLKSRGFEPTLNSPLFVKLKRTGGKIRPLKTHLIQKLLRETAQRSELIDKENNGLDQNPSSPHALREAFGSIMSMKGVPDSLVDFWLGHTIGEMSEAYKKQRFEDAKRMYAERERFISITVPENQGLEEAIKEAKQEAEDRTQKLRENFDNLFSENVNLKQKLDGLEKKIKPFDQLYQTLVNTFGEEHAQKQLERLFVANKEALEQYDT